jgi:hypothetical protein
MSAPRNCAVPSGAGLLEAAPVDNKILHPGLGELSSAEWSLVSSCFHEWDTAASFI